MFGPTAIEESGGAATAGRTLSRTGLRAPSGVGIGYVPFLHGLLVHDRDAFDFVEIPLDLYLDEARRGLLDPGLRRLDAVAAAKACSWRGSAFSLASADAGEGRSTEAAAVRLLARTGAGWLSETLAFRRVGARDLGLPQIPPPTAALAELAGPRYDELADRLPCGLLVELSATTLTAAAEGDARAFLAHLAARTACGIVLDLDEAAATGDPAPLVDRLRALPPGRVVQIALRSTSPTTWPVLDAVIASTGAGSITIRRSRNLFPLDEILDAVERARAALSRGAAGVGTREPAPASGSAPVGDLGVPAPGTVDEARAALARDQAAFAERCLAPDGAELVPEAVAAVRLRAAWRERIADIHRSKQLARWAARPATWSV